MFPSSDFISQVSKQSQYAPPPPPIIVRSDEAGSQSESLEPNEARPIIWLRYPPRYDLKPLKPKFGYDGLLADTNPDASIYAYSLTPVNLSSPDNSTLKLAISGPSALHFESGLKYLLHIQNEKCTYPDPITNILNSLASKEITVELLTSSVNALQLYLPRNIRESDIVLIRFILTSLYWLRYFRPEYKQLNVTLGHIRPIDLYLNTSNPYERYPARKLLSYYNDPELYSRFGQLGAQQFPKSYSSKQQLLDGLVAFHLFPFGYFTVKTWSRPIKLHFNRPLKVFPQSNEIRLFEITLEQLLYEPQVYQVLSQMTVSLPLAILRLVIQVQSSWPWIKDKEAWVQLFDYLKMQYQLIQSEYAKFAQGAFISFEGDTTLSENFNSLEEKYLTCLLCEQVRSEHDFGLCGHGVCKLCQMLIGSVKCPFCNEHFVIPGGITDDFVRTLRVAPNSFQQKIQEIKRDKDNRLYRFDWSNLSVQLFGWQ